MIFSKEILIWFTWSKHSAFDASQRDDSAHIFKKFETQNFGELWVKRWSKLVPGGLSAEWWVAYGPPSGNMACRIRSHQNTFRHHFWCLYIRMCPKNYPKKFRVILHIWWPEMSNFGFSSQNDQFEREREKWLWVGENHSIDPIDHTSCDKKLFFRVAPRKLIQISPKKNHDDPRSDRWILVTSAFSHTYAPTIWRQNAKSPKTQNPTYKANH